MTRRVSKPPRIDRRPLRFEDIELTIPIDVAGRVVRRAARSSVRPLDHGQAVPISALMQHRVLPLFVSGEAQVAEVREQLRSIAALQLKLRAVLDDVLRVLEPLGDEVRVLKGLASAELDYPERSLRHTGDIDLLVLDGHLAEALSLLTSNGFEVVDQPTCPGSLRRSVGARHPDGVEIDLHRHVTMLAGRRTDLLFDAPEPLENGFSLSREGRLVTAALRYIQTPPGHRRLSGLADVAAISVDVDVAAAREMAGCFDVEGIVRATLELSESLGGPALDLSMWSQPTWFDRLVALQSTRRPLALERLYWATALQDNRQRLAYGRSLIRSQRTRLRTSRRIGR